MAAPQFFTPPRVKPSRSKRRFTLQQANSTLPLVSRIVADIVRIHRDFASKQAQIERMPANSKNRAPVEAEIEAISEKLNRLVGELTGVGCELKDPQTGLIDFIGRHQGRDIYLCWKQGEESIGFWHELDAGAAGRQPIATLDEREG
jgi:hypothetical protein